MSDFDSDDSIDLDQLDKEVASEKAKAPAQGQSNNSGAIPGATHHKLDLEAAKYWIYPTNLPIRDYQYNITQQALFKNVLCALPTGLGKTFIASTVMLNWYRWTKDAKIIFMAPTRPLVSQQVEACLGITGIPKSVVSVMIGGTISSKLRSLEWQNKRIFFATPQTVENDLKKGLIHPKEVVLLVIDEAHRATGRYAYTNVVNYLIGYNKSFRVLSLTATPSGTVEGVQEILTNLKVSKAEVRTEESIDIQRYVHKRDIEKIQCEQLPELNQILDLFVEAVDPLVEEMRKSKLLYGSTRSLAPFTVLTSFQRYNNSPASRNFKNPVVLKNRAIMKILISVSRALVLLKIHGIRQFYDKMTAIKNAAMVDSKGKRKEPSRYMGQLLSDENYQRAMQMCEELLFTNGQVNKQFMGHGKLMHLVEEMDNFFGGNGNSDSRAIVFVEFRESAAEVCRVLASNVANAKPHLFLGQQGEAKGSSSKKTDEGASEEMVAYDEHGEVAKKGMTQKEQQNVVKEFKNGKYNILVATSIGEEGLDIGQVDLIVCYDQSKSPIRGLQRMGRTGRKRSGRIVMLLAENEDRKLEHALNGYKYIQERINGKNGGFNYAPVNKILPEDIKPEVKKCEIEIPPENKDVLKGEMTATVIEQMVKKNKGKKIAAPKRRWFKPDGAQEGFVKASELKPEPETFDSDDDWPLDSITLPESANTTAPPSSSSTSASTSNPNSSQPRPPSSSSSSSTAALRRPVSATPQPAKPEPHTPLEPQMPRSTPARRNFRPVNEPDSTPVQQKPLSVDLTYKGHDPSLIVIDDDDDDDDDDVMITHSTSCKRYLALAASSRKRQHTESSAL